jgi:hypothetical protein
MLNGIFMLEDLRAQKEGEKDIAPFLRLSWVNKPERGFPVVESIVERREFGQIGIRSIDRMKRFGILEVELYDRQLGTF